MGSNGRPLVPYLRQSRAKERTISIEEQRRDIRAWADAAGVELAPEVVEQNVSGSKPWRERALGEAVDACERGEASGVIVAWQDRLSRENGRATAEVWEALERAGARLVCAAEGLDTATGDHEMLFTIKAAIAREQWKRHRANWERAKRNATDRGVPSGRAPIGYRKRRGQPLEVAPREAAKVLSAFELRAQGVPLSDIGRRFGWSHSTARQILANETYLGAIRHGGFVKLDAHPAIVPRDLFDAAQAARTVRPAAPGALTRDRILQGLARCAGCGRTLKVVHRPPRADGSRVSAYFCKDAAGERCPERAYVHADALDAFVVDWFTRALASVPRMVDVVAQARDLEEAHRALAAAEAELAAFVENASALDPALFQRGVDARQKRADDARAHAWELSGRVTRLPSGGTLVDLWAGFDPVERRRVLGGFLGRVDVRRGASSRLAEHTRIVWADGSVADVANDEAGVRVAAA
jgi:DNA invertase Pin-like site-specific DNA recombinase